MRLGRNTIERLVNVSSCDVRWFGICQRATSVRLSPLLFPASWQPLGAVEETGVVQGAVTCFKGSHLLCHSGYDKQKC